MDKFIVTITTVSTFEVEAETMEEAEMMVSNGEALTDVVSDYWDVKKAD